MDFLKELFGEEALTFDQLSAKVTEKSLKLADLSTGNYVAKKKYDDEVGVKDTSIKDLQEQLKLRDKDLNDLKKQLADGSKDNETKITDLTAQVTKLQNDYKTATTEYQNKLDAQAYEFAVKEHAGTMKFTSEAAKREFIREMISANLKIENDTIIGATDFDTAYKAKNADSFVVEDDGKGKEGEDGGKKPPMFSKPGNPSGNSGNDTVGQFLDAMGFTIPK